MAANTSNIIIKDRYGNDIVYEGVSRIRTGSTDGSTKEFVIADEIPTPVETTVELNFTDGDMVVEPANKTVFENVTIPKPVGLVPENIVEGVEIAGITGTVLVPKIEELNVDLDFSEGDMVVGPSAPGWALSKVTVTKPEALVPENVRIGVEIGGVVGSLSDSSSGGSSALLTVPSVDDLPSDCEDGTIVIVEG